MNALWSEPEMPKPGHVGQSWPMMTSDLANHKFWSKIKKQIYDSHMKNK